MSSGPELGGGEIAQITAALGQFANEHSVGRRTIQNPDVLNVILWPSERSIPNMLFDFITYHGLQQSRCQLSSRNILYRPTSKNHTIEAIINDPQDDCVSPLVKLSMRRENWLGYPKNTAAVIYVDEDWDICNQVEVGKKIYCPAGPSTNQLQPENSQIERNLERACTMFLQTTATLTGYLVASLDQ